MSSETIPSISTTLAQHLAASRRASTPRATFWASSLGMCPRKQIAERAGLPPTRPIDQRSQFKMWTGEILGHAIQKTLEEAQYLDPAWTERRVVYRSVSGKLDGKTLTEDSARVVDAGTLFLPTTGAVVEIKTADDDAIKRPWPEHYFWQGYFYCLATRLDMLVLFQFGKNQGLARQGIFFLDDEWIQKLEEHITALDAAWTRYSKSGVLPDHAHRHRWEDRVCPYLEQPVKENANGV